ncbi:MAG: sulfatase-like hydrolase/transferase [Pseudomonadota bacterium]
MRILIIEDNPDIVANLYGFLEPRGHILDAATNGFGGLAFAAENTYDAIVLDDTLSDHGESLGEKNMYLHGTPYIISPPEQRQVPFILWLSESFRTRFHIDARCLAARSNQEFSHDNVFHSMLGMLAINTAVYNPKLDIFNACKNAR